MKIARVVFLSVVIAVMLMACGQKTRKAQKLLTQKYAGEYGYGSDPDSGAIGFVSVYPESDSTVLFYLDLCKGAPSYNLGNIYGRLVLKSDSTIYNYSEYENCKLKLSFYDDRLIINEVDSDCFFNGVSAGGTYQKTSDSTDKYFIGTADDTTYFSATSLKKWEKDQ